jgi:hypothetical protein
MEAVKGSCEWARILPDARPDDVVPGIENV